MRMFIARSGVRVCDGDSLRTPDVAGSFCFLHETTCGDLWTDVCKLCVIVTLIGFRLKWKFSVTGLCGKNMF